jgi:phosphate-selective porin
MKTFIRKSVITISVVLAATVSAFNATAKNNTLVYDKAPNTSIGIAVEHATGAEYTIRDQKGNIVLQGRIKNNKTFFIPTSKLKSGSYQFSLGNMILQEFVIK